MKAIILAAGKGARLKKYHNLQRIAEVWKK